jgi:hypothetical protein
MGLYSKFPELAFNQRVAGSSPARRIPLNQLSCERSEMAARLVLLGLCQDSRRSFLEMIVFDKGVFAALIRSACLPKA